MKNYTSQSIRTFIGSKNYNISRQFYKDLGFEEVVLFPNMCLFKVNDQLAFYLQDYYVKKWVNNSMIFLEVDDLENCEKDLLSRQLTLKYPRVKISEIQSAEWGREIFLHDPSGVLWHFGQFN